MTEESQREPGGIVISGGTVQIGALAQGSGAQASYRQVTDSAGWPSRQEREELDVLLQELLETLRRHDSEPAIWSAVEEVDAELSQERPDRSRLRKLLEKVATVAGPAAEIAAAAATLGRAIAGSG